VARTIDSDRKHLTSVLRAAAAHRGASFVEIYQNCPIFNDGAFDTLKEPGDKEQRLIPLHHGKPIRFGPNNEFAILRGASGGLEVGPYDPDRVVIHDAGTEDPSYAFALSRLSTQDLSHTVTGIYRNVSRPTYDDQARAQVAAATRPADLGSLLAGSDTWTVG
ncbi:MAG: 2-oxoacid:ferredoxin oxidoreductase subunit beta, partial [Actinophytocola sp.]